ncbi:conserved hypothetical protein [Gammaproteobacteria bacterium]
MPLITVKTFNAAVLNNSNFAAYGNGLRKPADANPVFIEQSLADPRYSGTFNISARSVPVIVTIKDYANRHALESQLKETLRPGKRGTLVGTFADDGVDYQLNCVVQSITPDTSRNGVFTVIFQSEDTCWRKVTATSDSWAVTASGDKKNLTVGGYSPTRLSLSITPTQLPAAGYAYARLYQLVNAPLYAYGLRPWCVAIDTAALVSGGKMQADGDDIVVVVDGVVVNRWLADINTNHTHIWFNINLSAGQNLTLLTPVSNTGTISTLAFQKTTNNKAALSAMPTRGYVQHGTEWFEYTGKDLSNYKLTGITRTALGTAIAAHALADVFSWIEHSIFILHGNSAATAPSLVDAGYDATKPVFDLSASDNTTWVYTASTKFYDPESPNRTGAWKASITKIGNVTDVYNNSGNVEGAAPAMGMRIGTWYKTGKATAEKATLTWLLNNPGGITTVSMTGRKYRNTTLWPAVAAAKLERSKNGSTFYEVWNEATPTALTTWEAITHAGSAITGNMATVRFSFIGNFAAQADTDGYYEVVTATVVFVSANQPTGTLGSERANYLLTITIKNNTSGDAISLLFPMQLNVALVLDGEAYTVLYGGVNAAAALNLDDPSRAAWIRLNPNAVNELEISGENVASLTILPSWYERRM